MNATEHQIEIALKKTSNRLRGFRTSRDNKTHSLTKSKILSLDKDIEVEEAIHACLTEFKMIKMGAIR